MLLHFGTYLAMKKNRHLLFALVVFLVTTILLFLPFFTKSLHPFPGDFQVAWFEPWRSSFNEGSSIQISHKPIADDIFRQLYPFKILAASMIQRLELPLWNP